MRVIDLLNKIANGEFLEFKHFKYTDRLDGETDICLINEKNIIYKLNEEIIELNDEIEIIEEDKKIEKIYELNNESDEFKVLRKKINEIIDKLNAGVDKE